MPEVIAVPTKEWKKLVRIIERLDADKEEWINEDQARQLLGSNGKSLSQSTIYNMRRSGKIEIDAYRVGVGGNIFYNKQKLMGL